MRHPIKRRAPRKTNTPWRLKRSKHDDVERKSAESPQKNELGQSEPEKGPPNRNLRKHPDEAYGDTEIPRHSRPE
jgi:hypothetical protein